MNLLVIVDIDGTIADASFRFASAGAEPNRDNKLVYDDWVRKVQNETSLMDDPAVPGMFEFVLALQDGGADVVFLTSREEKWRRVTRWWMENNYFNIVYAPLVMRPNGDYSEGCEFKERAIKQLVSENTPSGVIVIDDDGRGDIEAMCKKNKYTFLKARSGGQL